LKPLRVPSAGPAQAGPEWAGSVSGPAAGLAPQVEIVIPVRNEECALAPSGRRLAAFLRAEFPYRTRITIADNGSSDGTWAVAEALAAELAEVRAVRLAQPGRGRALKACWLHSDAEILAYMDVDLSSALNALLPLVSPLLSGHSDIAIGTRLARGARVSRGSRREIISRCYNLLLHAVLDVGFSDAQCGFKAIRADKARWLLPLTEDNAWFFDTELLVLAERAGLRVHEVPVDWTDDPNSSVDVIATAIADLRGIGRLVWRLARGTVPVPVSGEPAKMSQAPRGLRGHLRDRRGQRGGLCCPFSRAPGHAGRAGGQRGQPAGDRGRQHGGQPAGYVRHPRARARGPPSDPGAARPRAGPGAHVGGPGRADRHRARAVPRHRGHRAGGR
jgi:Glycosyl transferase family 2